MHCPPPHVPLPAACLQCIEGPSTETFRPPAAPCTLKQRCLQSWYVKALVSRFVCIGMMACSLVLHGMNSLTTNYQLVVTHTSTYTTHCKPCPVHIEAHIQMSLCDHCSGEATLVCITCLAMWCDCLSVQTNVQLSAHRPKLPGTALRHTHVQAMVH